jgi:urea transport system permease protein
MLKHFFILITLLFFASPSWSSEINDQQLSEKIQPLTQKKLKQISKAIDELSQYQHARIQPILDALLNNHLYYLRSSKEIIITEKIDNNYFAIDAISSNEIGELPKSKIKKIKTNNKIRKKLRTILAKLSLSNPNTELRLMAAKNLRKSPSPEATSLLENAVKSEKDHDVKEVMTEALNIIKALNSNLDESERIAAINLLKDSLSNDARNALTTLSAKNNEGEFEHSENIALVAEKASKSIAGNVSLYGYLETAFFGLSLGSVLLLAAIGLAITFGVMGVINMAHGEMIMIGAYTTYVMQLIMPNLIGLSIWVAIPAAFIVAGMVGIIMERLVIRHLYGRPLETLLATFGISLVLQQLVRTIFSPLNMEVVTPDFMTGSLYINDALSLTYNRLYIIVFALLVFFAVLYIMKKTTLGLQVRAVTQNREMAKAMGINTDRIDMITFGLGSGLAGIAGVALSQLTNVGPNLGQAYIIDSFMVVVFGGVGNLWGTLIAAFTLGELTKFIEPIQGAVLAKVIVLIFIILFIQKRPRGLFPQKGRDAEG